MSWVALAVSLASSLTSLATTAKPLPASPARAASMVAFSASRLVCSAMLLMTLITLPISVLLSPRRNTAPLAFSAMRTASEVTVAAWLVLPAMSRMLPFICSAETATVFTLFMTCSDAADTTLACAAVSSALALICSLTSFSSSEAVARVSAWLAIWVSASRIDVPAWLTASAISVMSPSAPPRSAR